MGIMAQKEKRMSGVTIVCCLIGVFSISYYLYDLKYPNHFVGDMYGMEVMFRMLMLLLAASPLILGVAALVMGWHKRSQRFSLAGMILVIISAVLLSFMAIRVSWSRKIDAQRKAYHQKSTAELIRIVLEQQDQYAMYAIIAKKDPTAISPLCDILLDEHQNLQIRIGSAHALGDLGGEMAKKTLDKALTQSQNEYLTRAIQYARASIDQQAKKGSQ